MGISTPIANSHWTSNLQSSVHNLVDKESSAGGWEQLKGDRKLVTLKAVSLLQAAEVRATPNVPIGNHPRAARARLQSSNHWAALSQLTRFNYIKAETKAAGCPTTQKTA